MTQITQGAKSFFIFLKTSTGGISPAFDTGGTGTGASTGSTHGGTISAGPGIGKHWVVQDMHVAVGGKSADLYSTKYGGRAAFTIGAKVKIITDTGDVFYLFDTTSVPIKDAHNWGQIGDEARILGYKTITELNVVIELGQVYGGGQHKMILDGDAKEKIAVHFPESTTGVVHHHYAIHGVEIDK